VTPTNIPRNYFVLESAKTIVSKDGQTLPLPAESCRTWRATF
jgi:hypothetical protein